MELEHAQAVGLRKKERAADAGDGHRVQRQDPRVQGVAQGDFRFMNRRPIVTGEMELLTRGPTVPVSAQGRGGAPVVVVCLSESALMWDGTIDARHLYTALRLTVHTYDRTSGAPTSTTGAGTGFVMARKLFNRTEPGLLVTNRHVLDPSFTDRFGLALDKVVVSGWRQRVHKDRLSGRAERFEFTINSPEPVLADGNADIAIIDLATAEIPGGCPEVTELRTTRLADSLVFEYRLHVGARILVPGYPSIGHVATVRPVLMGGTIASDPREDAVFGPGAYPGCVLSHSFSWGGMSGAPVFASLPKKSPSWDDMEQHRPEELFLIGVNRGHLKVGGTDEGAVTYFAKSMALARLLKSVGAQVLMKEWSDFEADDDAPLLEVEDVLLGSADDEPVA